MQKKVTKILRTKKEGLKPGFAKPHASKHKCNPGGYVSILASSATIELSSGRKCMATGIPPRQSICMRAQSKVRSSGSVHRSVLGS